MDGVLTDVLAAAPGITGLSPAGSAISGVTGGEFAQLLASTTFSPAGSPVAPEGFLPQPGVGDGRSALAAPAPVLLLPDVVADGNRLPTDGNVFPLAAGSAVALTTDVPPLDLPDGATQVAPAPTAWTPTATVTPGPIGQPAQSALADSESETDPDDAIPIGAPATDIVSLPAKPLSAITPRGLRSGQAASAPVETLADEIIRQVGQPVAALAGAAEVAVARDIVAAADAGPTAALSPDAAVDAVHLRPMPADPASAPVAKSPGDSALTAAITEPVGTKNWQDAMGRQLTLMVDKGVGRAELRMDPPELGPIEIQLTVRDDKALVAFQAQHSLTREALETALPRLREMLADQGISLAEANVSDQPPGQDRQLATGDSAYGGSADDADTGDAALLTTAAASTEALVDLYA